jgi:hypothetical protein
MRACSCTCTLYTQKLTMFLFAYTHLTNKQLDTDPLQALIVFVFLTHFTSFLIPGLHLFRPGVLCLFLTELYTCGNSFLGQGNVRDELKWEFFSRASARPWWEPEGAPVMSIGFCCVHVQCLKAHIAHTMRARLGFSGLACCCALLYSASRLISRTLGEHG